MGVIEALKAKLRAWLIDLMREAVREEMAVLAVGGDLMAAVPNPTYFPVHGGLPIEPTRKASKVTRTAWDTAEGFEIRIDPSFEQIQADSIQEQAKFYEVVK